MRAKEFIVERRVDESWRNNALVAALVAALSAPTSAQAFEPSPPQEPTVAAQAVGILRMINRYKDYNEASLEGEARQELGNIFRTLQGHPNQSKVLPIVKDIINSDQPINVPKSQNLNQKFPRP